MRNDFSIYANLNGSFPVTDEVDLAIMRSLEKGGKSINVISQEIGKEPKTVSNRLKKLQSNGLVVSGKDPVDTRKVIYTPIVRPIISSVPTDNVSQELFYKHLNEIATGEAPYFTGLSKSILRGGSAMGVDVSPAFTVVGEYIGKRLAEGCAENDFLTLFKRLKEYTESQGLLKIEFTMTYYVNVRVHRLKDAVTNVNSEDFIMTATMKSFEEVSGRPMYRGDVEKTSDGFTFKIFFAKQGGSA